MIKIPGGLVLGWMMGVCQAAEIVAWKVPGIEWLEEEGVVLREAPPENSPFFAAGDELWDLKGVPAERLRGGKALDWLVWNATAGRIVAKGEWADIYTLHKHLRPNEAPRQCLLTLDFYQVAADGAAKTADARPVAALSLICRSGQLASASWRDGGKSITIKSETTFYDSDTLIDTVLDGSVEVPGQARMEFNTRITLVAGKPTWIVRDFDGKLGLDLWAAGDPVVVITTLEANDIQTRLLSRPGQKAGISRVLGKKSIQRCLEIEPTLNYDEALIDMRLFFEDLANPLRVTHLNSAATLTTGKPLEMLSGTAEEGREVSLRIKGEVYRLPGD